MQNGLNFSGKVFANHFHYDGSDLGARVGDAGTSFRLWAPTAEAVKLRLYQSGHLGEAEHMVLMQRQEKGVWSWPTTERLEGIYYDYEVMFGKEKHQTADPYARACGCSGFRSMVVDLEQTNPPGWNALCPVIIIARCQMAQIPMAPAAAMILRVNALCVPSIFWTPCCIGQRNTI